MARHVHMFYRQEVEAKSKYMWKCANCSWFVHAGLEHVLIGKKAECWNCGDTFTVTQTSLEQDKLKCVDCAMSFVEVIEPDASVVTDTHEETVEEKLMRERRQQILEELMNGRKR